MVRDQLEDQAGVEIICPKCGYRTMRTAARLRRETEIMCPECGAKIVSHEGGNNTRG